MLHHSKFGQLEFAENQGENLKWELEERKEEIRKRNKRDRITESMSRKIVAQKSEIETLQQQLVHQSFCSFELQL